MWIPITEDDPESANNPLAADLVNEMAAVFIDDGDPHRLVRLLRNPNGTGTQLTFHLFNFYPTSD